MTKVVVKKSKSLVSSKVFWFNILAGVIAVASLFGFADFEPSQEVTEIIALVTGLLNIVLRLKTSEPITKL
jgi:hypothetical protein